ncbi:hypothetical protein HELRODRAFT_123629, partial [Helobdella robusta]
LFSLNYFIHALSGSLGNIFAILLFYPLDTVRTRLQVQENRRCQFTPIIVRDIVILEGWHSLYKGWQSLTLSIAITSFTYFYIFHGLKLYVGVESQSIFKDIIFGTISGIITVSISNPFWVINTRLKLQHLRINNNKNKINNYNNNNNIIINYNRNINFNVYKEDGLKFYFYGLTSSLLLVTNPVVNFMVYEFCKRSFMSWLLNFFSDSILFFAFGGLAKLLATVVTYPLQVVQTRSRVRKRTFFPAFISLSKVRYFFRGLESKLLQTVLTSAFMFLIYENLTSLL